METTDTSNNRRTLWLGLGALAVIVCLCLVLVAAVALFFITRRGEQTIATPAAEYILDVSARMDRPAAGVNDTRLGVARGVMAEVLRPADPAVAAGLRIFGQGGTQPACEDTSLLVPLAPATQPQIAAALDSVTAGPAGDAALARAMIAAIQDLTAVGAPRSLVVVTGGQDSCLNEAGQLVAQEISRANIDLKTFVIGFQVDPAASAAIKGMVEVIGDGAYIDAPDGNALRQALETIQAYVEQPGNETVAAIDALAETSTGGATPVAGSGTPVATATATTPPIGQTPTTGVTPSPANTAAPTATPGSPTSGGGDQGQTACDHPFFPLRPGATWTYQGESEGESFGWTWTVLEVSGDRDNATAIMSGQFDFGATATYSWQCTREGIVSYDLANLSFSGLGLGDSDISMELVSGSGVFLPPAGQMTLGAGWDNAFSMQGTFAAEGQSMSVTLEVTNSYTVAGEEALTTAAGSFQALRLGNESTYTSAVSVSPGSPPTAVSFNDTGSLWFARGVGWVKSVTSGLEGSSSWELVSYSVP